MAVAAGRPTERKQPENPLTDGLERQPVPPTTLVIFGATGDLARRKLLPALYNLAHDGALPERFYLVGVARKEKDHEDYRRECEEAIDRFSRRKPDPDVLKALLENVRYVPGTFDDDSVYATLGGQLDEFEKQAGEPLNRAFYLSTAPAFFPVIVGKLGESKLSEHARRTGALRHREAVRHLARGGARAQPRGARGLRREPGLPHRPLPRQGDRPEPAGVPLRQRHVRAAVEPQLHRQRPDHRGRGHRHRHARGLLRPRRRAARPDPEPHAAAALPRGDGAARQLHRRRGAQREGQGARRDPRADARARSPRWPSARSTDPGTPAARTCPATSKRRACRPTRTPRPTPRCAWRSTTGAGRACRSTCAPASAWRARSPRSRSRSSRSRTSPSARTARSACSPTSSC